MVANRAAAGASAGTASRLWGNAPGEQQLEQALHEWVLVKAEPEAEADGSVASAVNSCWQWAGAACCLGPESPPAAAGPGKGAWFDAARAVASPGLAWPLPPTAIVAAAKPWAGTARTSNQINNVRFSQAMLPL